MLQSGASEDHVKVLWPAGYLLLCHSATEHRLPQAGSGTNYTLCCCIKPNNENIRWWSSTYCDLILAHRCLETRMKHVKFGTDGVYLNCDSWPATQTRLRSLPITHPTHNCLLHKCYVFPIGIKMWHLGDRHGNIIRNMLCVTDFLIRVAYRIFLSNFMYFCKSFGFPNVFDSVYSDQLRGWRDETRRNTTSAHQVAL